MAECGLNKVGRLTIQLLPTLERMVNNRLMLLIITWTWKILRLRWGFLWPKN